MNARKTVFLALLPMSLAAQEAREDVPLRHWATPLYWHPSAAERETGAPRPELQFAPNAVSRDALTFVAITPCRLIDTRGIAGGFDGIHPFSGPSLKAGDTATFPVQSDSEAIANTQPAPCGAIPLFAQAYSLNLTVIPKTHGPASFVTLWQAGAPRPIVATINDSQHEILNNAAIVAAGTPSGGISVYNAGPATIDVVIDMNGFFAAPTDLSNNTSIGAGSLQNDTTGTFNTATGGNALLNNTAGVANTATGFQALLNNTSAGFNTAVGAGSLFSNVTGDHNTAVGAEALTFNATGASNIALGDSAGIHAPPDNSNSIYIGSLGSASDSAGTIQIGTGGTQTSFFAAGITGVTTGANDAVAVVIDSHGQLGTINSSQRFKEDIQDMGDASDGLLRLRPVTYRYKQAYEDGSKPLDYGLIAEEVATIYPDLVVRDRDGKIQTVQYQKLTPMLLNELQKQAEQIRTLEDRLAQIEEFLNPSH
jgi:hypothetical protein